MMIPMSYFNMHTDTHDFSPLSLPFSFSPRSGLRHPLRPAPGTGQPSHGRRLQPGLDGQLLHPCRDRDLAGGIQVRFFHSTHVHHIVLCTINEVKYGHSCVKCHCVVMSFVHKGSFSYETTCPLFLLTGTSHVRRGIPNSRRRRRRCLASSTTSTRRTVWCLSSSVRTVGGSRLLRSHSGRWVTRTMNTFSNAGYKGGRGNPCTLLSSFFLLSFLALFMLLPSFLR